jgi:beta-lactam-binding protein with PASTA domain
MGWLRFLFSFTFVKQLVKALVIAAVFLVLLLYSLGWHTRQGQFVEVPDLSRQTIDQVVEIMDDVDLRFEVIDSANYNPSFEPFAVIEHLPKAGEKVKKDRKIYLTLNPYNYREISVPDVIQITYRNAASTLRAVGLEIGEISYRDNIGKDMVLQLRYKGEAIIPGVKVPKTSPIDLVLGNGKTLE